MGQLKTSLDDLNACCLSACLFCLWSRVRSAIVDGPCHAFHSRVTFFVLGAAAAAAAEQAFCRTECGYAGVLDVEDLTLDDQMPSFFLSETLKYLYLLFDEVNGAFCGCAVGPSVQHRVILQRQPPRCFQSFGKSYGFENNMLTTPSVVSLRLYDPPTDCYSRLRRSVL